MIVIYHWQWKCDQKKIADFSVFRCRFGKGADQELTDMLLHICGSAVAELGTSTPPAQLGQGSNAQSWAEMGLWGRELLGDAGQGH